MESLRVDSALDQMKDRGLTRGQGILWDIVIPLDSLNLNNTSVTLSSGLEHIELDNTNETVTASFIAPGNYDDAEYDANGYTGGDVLELLVTAKGDVAGASTIEIDSVEVFELGETAVTSKTVSASAQTVSGTTLTTYTFSLSGLEIDPGDAVNIQFSMGTDSTNDIEVYGVRARYRSTILLSDENAAR